MTDTLLAAVTHYAQAHVNAAGVAATPIPGMAIMRSTAPTGLEHAISRPLVCLVLQGGKQVAIGTQTLHLRPGDSLLITADRPMVSQITHASPDLPYLSMVLELDPAVLADLSIEMQAAPPVDGLAARSAPTDAEVADTALRLMRLLERPQSIPVLQASLIRELHYWLLSGRHGLAIRGLGLGEGHAQRVARAVALLRADFTRPMPVERLAAAAGMSASSFHHHFRAATSLSPVQFQKQLRLIEARRLMVAEGCSASSAAFAVGYESVSQFTREYSRMFGQPPAKDAEALRHAAPTAA